MNQALWVAIREYIATEIQLGLARDRSTSQLSDSRVRALEDQSTRMETDIRRRIDLIERRDEQLRQVSDFNTVLR